MDEELGRSGINIAHLNVASILAKHKFEMLRQQVESSNLHVLGISETWLKKDIPDGIVGIKGFEVVRLDRNWENKEGAGAKRGGGLACFVSENIVSNAFKFAYLNKSTCDLEMQWVLLDMPKMRNIVIVNIYRPPQGDYKKACKFINEALQEADLKDNVEVFLMGDFNIDWKDKKSPMVKELDLTTSMWGLKAMFKEDTRIGVTLGTVKGSCIDNIFTNSEYILNARILSWNYSDHLVVAVKRKRLRVIP